MAEHSDKSDIQGMLEEHQFVKGLGKQHIAKLAEIAEPRTYQPNTRVFKTGEPATACFLLRSGAVLIELHDPSRGHVVLQTIGPDSVLGWSWLVPPYKWCFDANTRELTRVLALDAARLRTAIETDHELGYQMLNRFCSVFAERLHAARLQLLDMFGPAR